ncbi:MAG TPA: hypothetical protein VFC05_03205 [Nitrososphaeraceae archaeon]|jgi:sialic acid synthase SpsE|nr:hypothetical protein [Nitrososphaeraceae archaeon]
MGRTIPSFKIAAVIEEKQWKLLENILRNKNEKKLFTGMFSLVNLFISACSNAVNLIRIHSYHDVIILHHSSCYKSEVLV